ncbi:unnamed protein product [Trichogramma brassicae]|uniref:Uncharacterized protein n=1 Tax=Trichogramma brassicae TaxID=86971 RepID=A0A6H5IDY3_9HYME|nr:unnamed protein product [Trichogramma brassicae]
MSSASAPVAIQPSPTATPGGIVSYYSECLCYRRVSAPALQMGLSAVKSEFDESTRPSVGEFVQSLQDLLKVQCEMQRKFETLSKTLTTLLLEDRQRQEEPDLSKIPRNKIPMKSQLHPAWEGVSTSSREASRVCEKRRKMAWMWRRHERTSHLSFHLSTRTLLFTQYIILL